MSISAFNGKDVYTGNGKTKSFGFGFKVWDPGQVKVYVSDGDRDLDVTGEVDVKLGAVGGTVKFDTAPASGVKVAILRNMPFTQQDQYISGSRFDAFEVEDRLDQDCSERQQLLEAVNRALKVPATSDQSPEEYQKAYLDSLGEMKSSAAAAATQAAASAAKAQETATQAAASAEEAERNIQSAEERANAALRQVQETVKRNLEEVVQSCLDLCEKANATKEDIEALLLEASEHAAACIIAKCTGAAELCLQYAAAAEASSCAATLTQDNIWAIIREMSIDAGEEAAQCVLAQCQVAAETTKANASAAAASASAAAATVDCLSEINIVKERNARVAGDEALKELIDEQTKVIGTLKETVAGLQAKDSDLEGRLAALEGE